MRTGGRSGGALGRSRVPVTLLIVLVASSGCLFPPLDTDGLGGGGGPGGTGTGTAGARTFSWTLSECRFLVWYVETDAADLAPFVPEGLVVGRVNDALGRERGRLGLESYECRSGSGLRDEVTPMRYASLFIPVQPEDQALHVDGVEQYYVKLHPLIPDDERRTLFVSLGLDAVDGAVVHESTRGPTDLEVLDEAQFTLDGIGTFTFSGAATEATGPEDRPFVQFSAIDGVTDDADDDVPADAAPTLALWQARSDVASYRQGHGSFTLSEGSLPARILGTTSGQAPYVAGTWSVGPGNLTFPASSTSTSSSTSPSSSS